MPHLYGPCVQEPCQVVGGTRFLPTGVGQAGPGGVEPGQEVEGPPQRFLGFGRISAGFKDCQVVQVASQLDLVFGLTRIEAQERFLILDGPIVKLLVLGLGIGQTGEKRAKVIAAVRLGSRECAIGRGLGCKVVAKQDGFAEIGLGLTEPVELAEQNAQPVLGAVGERDRRRELAAPDPGVTGWRCGSSSRPRNTAPSSPERRRAGRGCGPPGGGPPGHCSAA